jgi:heme-degrading monooxygenase HmoA
VHARVTSYQSPPEQMTDAAVDNMNANLLPRVFEMDGNRGAILLMDRQTGKTMTITLWESEEAMRASEEKANPLRADTAQTTSASIGNVERFEVPSIELR